MKREKLLRATFIQGGFLFLHEFDIAILFLSRDGRFFVDFRGRPDDDGVSPREDVQVSVVAAADHRANGDALTYGEKGVM